MSFLHQYPPLLSPTHIGSLAFRVPCFLNQPPFIHLLSSFSNSLLYFSYSFFPVGLCQLYLLTITLVGLQPETNMYYSYTLPMLISIKIILSRNEIRCYFFGEGSVFFKTQFQVETPVCNTGKSKSILVRADKLSRLASDCS